jgi:hypothetical protein
LTTLSARTAGQIYRGDGGVLVAVVAIFTSIATNINAFSIAEGGRAPGGWIDV